MIEIVVLGTPRPGGSKTPFRYKKTKKLGVRDANPNTAVWRAIVAKAAKKQYQGPLLEGAVSVDYDFRFERPNHHYGSGRNSLTLKPDAPYWHTVTPDLTKIIRSTEDSLKGIVWRDDSQDCRRTDRKRYCQSGEREGVTIRITEISNAND